MHKTNPRFGPQPLPLLTRLLLTFLRTFFKLLYHQFAWVYDIVACLVSVCAWQQWVRSLLTYLEGPRTLEIGFGTGHLLEGLALKGVATFGLDESPQMGQIARRRLGARSLHANLIRGDARALPFAAEAFHQVALTFPSEYVLHPDALLEIQRILVAGGVATVLPLAWITGRKPWEQLVAWVNHVTGQTPEWTESSLAPLKQAGFDASWEMKQFSSSHILLIHLRKL